MSRAGGPAVANGTINYLSPSALTTADHESFGGCQRRYHFRYVGGKKEPQTAAARGGVETHAEIERYLKTGEKAFSTLTLAGMRYIPKPSEGMLIEHQISTPGFDVCGVPLLGFIDLVVPGPRYIDEEGRPCSDPDGTVELVDWKTTSDIQRNGKSAHEMSRTIQMVTYARWAVQVLGAHHARVSHVYFQTRGRSIAKKVTARLTGAEVAARWGRVETVAKKLLDVVRVDPADSNRVEANTRSCDAYGGCPHRSYCTAGQGDSLLKFFGAAPEGAETQTRENDMGVSDNIKAQIEKLKADEAAKIAAAAPAPAAVPAGADPRFVAAWKAIEGAGKGTPCLTGGLAQARATMLGVEITRGAALAGSGLIGSIQIGELADLLTLAAEIAPGAASAAPAPAPVQDVAVDLSLALPPDAPESKPELAAKPPGDGTILIAAATPIEPGTTETTTTRAAPESPVASPKTKRGRPRKAETHPPTGPNTDQSDTLEIFVDCVPSVPFEDLGAYVDDLCARLCKQEKAADVRCAPEQSALSFAKWRGALAAVAKAEPPPSGTYVIFTSDERAAVVAEALRGQCGLFVRGVAR